MGWKKMDVVKFYTEARKRIEPVLPPKHDLDTTFTGDLIGGFLVRKEGFMSAEPVINIPIKTKDDKVVYEVEPLDPKYSELALKIGKKLSEIT